MRLVNETKEQGWLPGLTWQKKFIVCTKRNITEFLFFLFGFRYVLICLRVSIIASSKNRTHYRFW